MADVKTLLKEARKLINDKNFKEAQECCKNILRKDKQNYLGLVLLGKSLQDTEQAPLAFQKAIACKSDHPLAWQGLANYYERQDDSATKLKLFNIYDEMLKLNLEEDKAFEILTKLGQLGSLLKNQDAIGIIVRFMMNDELESKIRESAEQQLIDLLKNEVPCKQEDIPSVLKVLNDILPKYPNKTELMYAKILLQSNDFVSAVEDVINLAFFSSNSAVREYLCNLICKKYVEKNSFCGLQIEKYVSKIIEGIENSKVASLLKSMILFEKSDYLEAYKQCVPLISYTQANEIEATFVIRCAIMLKKWSVAQKLAMNFLTKVEDEKFRLALRKVLFLSLARQHKWRQAISVIKEIPAESLNIDEQANLAECHIELNEDANHLMGYLEDSKYYLSLQALQLLKQNKYNETVALLQSNNDPLCLFYLGKAYWELKQYDLCQLNLLKAARLNPEQADIFLYLGHFYRYNIQDMEKAKKCYEKAYNLDSSDNEIAKNLSETYSELGLREDDFQLLSNAVKNINETWTNFRLGLHYLSKKDWDNAMIYFRNVIKKNHNDSVAFECLADAYFSRGSYTSALRAYQRVMALDSNREAHCQTRIGYIHCLLTQYAEAITVFETVLQDNPRSILALKGISETWMRIAKKKVTAKLYGSARDSAQQAVNYITKALTENKEYTCLWKILADTLMFVTKLPNRFAYVFMNPSLKESTDEQTKKEKLDIFPQAIACYSHIAKQKQQFSSYDLSSAYMAFYRESHQKVNCQVAFNLTVESIKRKPQLWRNWNLLGKICWHLKRFSTAQHCFIKALLVTRKWSVAKIWCNLGTLYLELKYYKLANYCYWRGQSTLPAYPHSWIGQALIAEAIREEEAMDLFRHASRLGYHPESALGYADWVCRTLRTRNKDDPEYKYVIEALYAIPYAIDLVEWFSCFEPDNAYACTVLGILQERFGLLPAAFTSYTKALQYAPKDKKNIALLNMGRILVRLQKYDEAIVTYKAITEASLNSACGLALSLFKKGLYEESYSAYDTALHWLSNNDDEKADLLVAMAGIMYMFKGPDDAKTLLFHSIQISQKKPTAFSLFAICSLGLLHSDQSLSKLALSELQKYEKESSFSYDIGFLKSYILVCEDSIEKAIKSLSETLHDHPSNAHLWFCMSQYCLKMANMRPKTASCCAQRALCSARGQNNCEPAKMMATASIAEHLAGNKRKAFTLAKEGLHMYPQQAEIWAALVFSLLANNTFAERKEWILAAAGHMRRHLEISRPLSRWAGFLEKKLSV